MKSCTAQALNSSYLKTGPPKDTHKQISRRTWTCPPRVVWLTRANQASIEMRSEEPGASDGTSRAQNTRSRKRPKEPGTSESDQSPELRSALVSTTKTLFLIFQQIRRTYPPLSFPFFLSHTVRPGVALSHWLPDGNLARTPPIG